jgi:predicted enzyme related to lactoylglutathione lyase
MAAEFEKPTTIPSSKSTTGIDFVKPNSNRKHHMTTQRNPVGWFELYVQDIERAKAFYQKTFQVTLERLESPGIELWAFPMGMDAPGASGALVKMDGKDSGGGGTLIYFSCADCAVEASRAVQNGGRVQKEKTSIGQYGFISLVFDTEGNMIGLHSMQ